MENIVLTVIVRETGIPVSPKTKVDALGLDSLDMIDLLLAISAETGKDFPPGKIAKMNTVGDIMREMA